MSCSGPRRLEASASACRAPEERVDVGEALALPRRFAKVPDALLRDPEPARTLSVPKAPLQPVPPDPVLFGYTGKMAAAASGNAEGSPFDPQHGDGDIANRWTHAVVVETVAAKARELGAGKLLAAAIGASVMIPQEYLRSLHADPADFVVNYEVKSAPLPDGGSTKLAVSVFGDGAVFAGVDCRFNDIRDLPQCGVRLRRR